MPRPARPSRALFRLRPRTDVYAPQEIIDKVKGGMGAPGTKSRSIRHHHGLRLPQAPVLPPRCAERHWERLLALYRRTSFNGNLAARCFLSHRLSRCSTRRDRDRADRDPLVCAGLYFGIVLGWLYARTLLKTEKIGMDPPRDARPARRLHPLGSRSAFILGGRSGYVLIYNFAFFVQHPVESLRTVKGGMSFTAVSWAAWPR